MTAQLTRRGAIGLLAAGACVLASPALAKARLAPPQTPMLFRRKLMREMAGGYSLTVERGFEIRFIPLAQGYRIEGVQVSSSVETPPVLAQIAELERNRVETGLFPVDLDGQGLILEGSGPYARPTPGMEQAIDLAMARFREVGSDEAKLQDASAFFQWLQQAAGTIGSEMPRELFVPPAEPQSITRAIELPGGSSGAIETRFSGRVAPETGLMRVAEREIVTRTEGTSRRSVESWSLAAI